MICAGLHGVGGDGPAGTAAGRVLGDHVRLAAGAHVLRPAVRRLRVIRRPAGRAGRGSPRVGGAGARLRLAGVPGWPGRSGRCRRRGSASRSPGSHALVDPRPGLPAPVRQARRVRPTWSAGVVMIRVRHGRDLTAAPRAARRRPPDGGGPAALAVPPAVPDRRPVVPDGQLGQDGGHGHEQRPDDQRAEDRAEDRRDVRHAEADAVPHHEDRQAGAQDDPGQQHGAGDAGPAGAGGWGGVGGHGLPHCARTAPGRRWQLARAGPRARRPPGGDDDAARERGRR